MSPILTVYILLILLAGIITVLFHFRQNSQQRIGGPITAPKSFWLGFAMFNYFVMPVFLYGMMPWETFRWILPIVIGLFYFRFFVQSFLMFVTKKWVPTYGIIHNIITVTVLLVLIFLHLRNAASASSVRGHWLVTMFLTQLILILLTDTYYARIFYRITGSETMGDNAIWFVGDDVKFDQLNRATRLTNYFFILFSVIIFYLVYLYGQF